MSLTPPEVGSLTSSMVRWEFGEYLFAALVTLACVGEGIAEFSKWFRGDENKGKRERLSKWSTIVLSSALALELVCLIKTNELSGEVIGSLDEKARDASEKALAALSDSTSATMKSEHAVSDANSAKQSSEKATLESDTAQKVASNAIDLATGAREEADSFEQDISAAKQQAANAESHLADAMKEAANAELELAKLKLPRALSQEQKERLVLELKTKAGQKFSFAVAGDSESIDLLGTLRDVFARSGWIKIPSTGYGAINVGDAALAYGRGVIIQFSPAAKTETVSIANFVAQALSTEGIASKAERDPRVGDSSSLNVLVGTKPLI